MAQETNTLETRNSVNNTAGGLISTLFTGLGGLITTAAPAAANLYSLKLQGEQLSQQYASQAEQEALQKRQAAEQAALNGSPAPFAVQPWMYWAGIGLVVALVVLLISRRR